MCQKICMILSTGNIRQEKFLTITGHKIHCWRTVSLNGLLCTDKHIQVTHAVFSFADFVDAKLSLTSAQFFLMFELVVDALAFCHRSLTSRLHHHQQRTAC